MPTPEELEAYASAKRQLQPLIDKLNSLYANKVVNPYPSPVYCVTTGVTSHSDLGVSVHFGDDYMRLGQTLEIYIRFKIGDNYSEIPLLEFLEKISRFG